MTDFACGHPQWDPDGTSLLCPISDSTGRALVRISREGRELARYPHRVGGVAGFGSFRFSPDGSRIYLRGTGEDGSEGVWWIPAAGGAATKAVAFDDPSLAVLFTLTVGRDRIYLTISEYESDIHVIDLAW